MSRNGAVSTERAKRRRCEMKPRWDAMASAPSSAPSPSAATSAPRNSGPPASTSRANTGSMCWYGKKSVFMRIVMSSTARTVGSSHAARKPAARVAPRETRGAAVGPPIRAGRPSDTSRPRPYSAATAPKHASAPRRARPTPASTGPAIFATCMETVSSETALATRERADEGEDRGAPRGEVQRPQDAEERLQPDERPVATAPCRKNGGEGEPGDEAERLRGE